MTEAHLSFESTRFVSTVAHDGHGTIEVARTTTAVPGSRCNFIDLVVVPVGATIGEHTHGVNDEEIYVVVEGRGHMTVDGETFEVLPGHIIVNHPGSTHGLANDGDRPLRLVVVDVAAPP
jgi:mannose-6-phosphate isomerase-like protein (cupin superfamily)